ncbi:MAG: hypothetical protein AAGL19_03210, partial [Pseudomonadota bacterium]
AEREGMDLMPELGTKPVNQYLPPRPKDEMEQIDVLAPYLTPVAEEPKGFLGWLDRALDAIPSRCEMRSDCAVSDVRKTEDV